MEIWAALIGFATLVVTVASFGLALVMLIRSMKKSNDAAHARIEQNIRDSNKGLKEDFNRRFDDLKDYIKLAMKVKDDG